MFQYTIYFISNFYVSANKMKNKTKYHTVGTVPKSNNKTGEEAKVILLTQIHDPSHSCGRFHKKS